MHDSYHHVLLHDAERQQWLSFERPLETVTALCPDEVLPALQKIEDLVENRGLFAAGFLTYEAAAAFDPACSVHPPVDQPLLWFGIYQAPHVAPAPLAPAAAAPLCWEPEWGLARFGRAVDNIHAAIAAGETYQVNLSFPLSTAFCGNPRDFFNRLVYGQHAGYAAYLDLGKDVICSVSPELFFRRDANRIFMRPMKGTSARGLTLVEDVQCKDRLRLSAKERAENIMILDMVRNDLGRLTEPGEVRTTGLCELEKYPTVWQMTSTVEAATNASLAGIMESLFPCASITGAPKYRTMSIIKQLEQRARGIYTGCIGYLAPQGRAQFSVAIRTVRIDRQSGRASYGVGAGITWDSHAAAEYQECLDKARVLTRTMSAFELFETLRWDADDGYFLLSEHIDRLTASASYFDYPCDPEQVIGYLRQAAQSFSGQHRKVRLRLTAGGDLAHEASPMPVPDENPVQLRLASAPIDRSDPFLYHKTTERSSYDNALAGGGDCDDVILWNQHGEVTETTIANLVFDMAGTLVTPPVASGLLAGTFRSHLLSLGQITEKVVSLTDIPACRQIYLINGVRGWRKALLTSQSARQ